MLLRSWFDAVSMLSESHIRVDTALYESCRALDVLTSQTAVFLFQCKSDQFSDHNTRWKTADFGVKERETHFSQTLAIPMFAAVVKECCDCKRPTGRFGVYSKTGWRNVDKEEKLCYHILAHRVSSVAWLTTGGNFLMIYYNNNNSPIHDLGSLLYEHPDCAKCQKYI